MGHHCHGRKRLSTGRPQKNFYLLSGKKFCGMYISPRTGGDGCGCLCPGDRDSYGCVAPDTTTGRGPAATTKSACAKRRCPLTSRRPFAGMPGAQVTARQRRRDRNGRCKPGGWRQGWKPARAETASLAPFTTARPTRGTPGKGISRRTTTSSVTDK